MSFRRAAVTSALLIYCGIASAGLQYTQFIAHKYSKVVADRPAFPASTPLQPSTSTQSPHGVAVAKVTQTDATKVPYDMETAYIEVTGPAIKPLYIHVLDFRNVTVAWATDRVLVIKRNMGRVADIEEIIDVVDRKWISQWSVLYVEDNPSR
jgi:hypothetical protein